MQRRKEVPVRMRRRSRWCAKRRQEMRRWRLKDLPKVVMLHPFGGGEPIRAVMMGRVFETQSSAHIKRVMDPSPP